MEDTYGKAIISIRHGELPTASCEFKISAAYKEEIKDVFGIDLGSCADGEFHMQKYFGEGDRKKITDVYCEDTINFNSNTDPDGEISKHTDSIEKILSTPGIYDVKIEYLAPKAPAVATNTTTAKRSRNLFDTILSGIRGCASHTG